MTGTFQNAGNSLSIGVFFSLMIAGLATTLPKALYSGLTTHGVPLAVAKTAANLPPVGNLFAAFLGINPIKSLLTSFHLLNVLPPSDRKALIGTTFFPNLISDPFHAGLVIVFVTAAILSVIGAVASIAAGGKYMHVDTARIKTVHEDEPVDAALSDV
ncbi:MAG: MFS transporter, partial [Galbitalea sp.]